MHPYTYATHTNTHRGGEGPRKMEGEEGGRDRGKNVRIHGVVPQATWEEWVYLSYTIVFYKDRV